MRRALLVLPGVALALVACSSGKGKHAGPSGAPTTLKPLPVQTVPKATQSAAGACAAGYVAFPRAAHPPAGLQLGVTLSAPAAKPGDTVSVTMTAKNCTAKAIDITHPSACAVEWGLYKNDGYVGGRVPPFCAQQIVKDSIDAHGVRHWTLNLDTKGDPNSSGERPELPPDTYEATIGIVVSGGIWYAAPAFLKITS